MPQALANFTIWTRACTKAVPDTQGKVVGPGSETPAPYSSSVQTSSPEASYQYVRRRSIGNTSKPTEPIILKRLTCDSVGSRMLLSERDSRGNATDIPDPKMHATKNARCMSIEGTPLRKTSKSMTTRPGRPTSLLMLLPHRTSLHRNFRRRHHHRNRLPRATLLGFRDDAAYRGGSEGDWRP